MSCQATMIRSGAILLNRRYVQRDGLPTSLIYREDQYDKDTVRKGIADIIIAKQRNGPTGDFKLTFLGQYTKFENFAPDAYGEGVLR